MSKSEPAKIILDFLMKNNRPYAVNDVLEKCGKELGKATVQKALDALVSKGKVTQKLFGKQKIYFIKHTMDMAQLKRELQICNQKLSQSQNSVKQKQLRYRELENKLKNLSLMPSLECLTEEQSKLFDEIREINEKLRQHEAAAAQAKYTPVTAKQIEERYTHLASSYRKRKRICTDMLDAILEGYPKSKKALIEDIGVETDEAVDFKVEVKR